MPAEGVTPHSGRRRTGYHGTSASNAQSILASGFNRSTGDRMLGAGVYWSDDIKKTRGYGDGTVLRLSVNCGKAKKITSQGHELQTSWHSNGYDTAWVPANCGMVGSGLSESCTYDPSRIRVTGISNDHGKTWRDINGGARAVARDRSHVCVCALVVAVVIPVVVLLNVGSLRNDYGGEGVDIDKCASSPCANGGTCSDVGADEYTCSCATGFAGDDCIQESLDCTGDDCDQQRLDWGWIVFISLTAVVMVTGFLFLVISMVPEVVQGTGSHEQQCGLAVFGLAMLVASVLSLVYATSSSSADTGRAGRIVLTFLIFAASAFVCIAASLGAIALHYAHKCFSKGSGLVVFATLTTYLAVVFISQNLGEMRVSYVDMAGTNRGVDVRIREGGSRGVLEMRIDDRGWDAVCDDGFGSTEANAVCYQLGFAAGGTSYDTTHGDDDFSVDGLSCPSGAVSLSECSTLNPPYNDNCDDDETVGIECYQGEQIASNCSFGVGDSVRVKSSVDTPRYGWESRAGWSATLGDHPVQVRIAGGGSSGVLEMAFDGGPWDAVCDDGFDGAEATAVCLTMGFVGGTAFDTTHGDSSFAADDIDCPSGATGLSQCYLGNSPYTHNCADSETVGISCWVDRGVSHYDCGIITSMGSPMKVDFPTYFNWSASVDEMERCYPCQPGEYEPEDDNEYEVEYGRQPHHDGAIARHAVLVVLLLLSIVVGMGVLYSIAVGIEAIYAVGIEAIPVCEKFG